MADKNLTALFHLGDKICDHSSGIWYPPDHKTKLKSVKTDSWFKIEEQIATSKPIQKHFSPFSSKFPKIITKCKKVKLELSQKQKEIMLKWMDSYQEMYNETIKYMRQLRINGEVTITSFKTLRTYHLKEDKDRIIQQSNVLKYDTNRVKTHIKAHMLDGAIKLACAMLKSALTNLQRGNISHFRLRYLKFSKNTRVIDIEKCYFSRVKSTICETVFGEEILAFYDDVKFDLRKVTATCKVHYDKLKNEFTLLVPEKVKPVATKKKEVVALDPGLRTFLTGFTEKRCVEIGSGISEKLNKYNDRIRKLENTKKTGKKQKSKKKTVRKLYTKIENVVDDLHWKTIKYLTTNFETIGMGNMSTKSIVSKKGNLNKKSKKIASNISLFKFKQRLQYKCKCARVGYQEIDERYTSKLCSDCAIYTDVGVSKTYKCCNCEKTIDRDINGARNIFMLCL